MRVRYFPSNANSRGRPVDIICPFFHDFVSSRVMQEFQGCLPSTASRFMKLVKLRAYGIRVPLLTAIRVSTAGIQLVCGVSRGGLLNFDASENTR